MKHIAIERIVECMSRMIKVTHEMRMADDTFDNISSELCSARGSSEEIPNAAVNRIKQKTSLLHIECCVALMDATRLRTVQDVPATRMTMPLSTQDLYTLYNSIMPIVFHNNHE